MGMRTELSLDGADLTLTDLTWTDLALSWDLLLFAEGDPGGA